MNWQKIRRSSSRNLFLLRFEGSDTYLYIYMSPEKNYAQFVWFKTLRIDTYGLFFFLSEKENLRPVRWIQVFFILEVRIEEVRLYLTRTGMCIIQMHIFERHLISGQRGHEQSIYYTYYLNIRSKYHVIDRSVWWLYRIYEHHRYEIILWSVNNEVILLLCSICK